MFNPRSIASQAEAPTPFPATRAADRGGKQRESINGRPDIDASGRGRAPGRGNVGGDTDLTSDTCASPRWKCGTATSAHMSEFVLLSKCWQ